MTPNLCIYGNSVKDAHEHMDKVITAARGGSVMLNKPKVNLEQLREAGCRVLHQWMPTFGKDTNTQWPFAMPSRIGHLATTHDWWLRWPDNTVVSAKGWGHWWLDIRRQDVRDGIVQNFAEFLEEYDMIEEVVFEVYPLTLYSGWFERPITDFGHGFRTEWMQAAQVLFDLLNGIAIENGCDITCGGDSFMPVLGLMDGEMIEDFGHRNGSDPHYWLHRLEEATACREGGKLTIAKVFERYIRTVEDLTFWYALTLMVDPIPRFAIDTDQVDERMPIEIPAFGWGLGEPLGPAERDGDIMRRRFNDGDTVVVNVNLMNKTWGFYPYDPDPPLPPDPPYNKGTHFAALCEENMHGSMLQRLSFYDAIAHCLTEDEVKVLEKRFGG